MRTSHMDEEDLIDITHSFSDELNIGELNVHHMYEPSRMAEVVRISKRHNGTKYGNEFAITDELLQAGHEDLVFRQLESAMRGLMEKMMEEEGDVFEYRDREIVCGVGTEYGLAQCRNCGYVQEFGKLPTHVEERHGTVQTYNTLEKWRRERLAIYMLEKTDRNCPCGKYRRRDNRKI
ncbi:hypothetical protein M199_gp270 [Halogranum tailed virus 1]|uniref:Uncharacterized protein n=1 Tax=Halogranum tailed virus 1 TaxID=1273749 RepID=R4TGP0_9CAUD|nr:hypothetical protein M199_gp270 [Halogranum tailed virus 1]AGM11396.1 hypothetical protein HGTV1_76 [Halogranum tailed virus 1]